MIHLQKHHPSYLEQPRIDYVTSLYRETEKNFPNILPMILRGNELRIDQVEAAIFDFRAFLVEDSHHKIISDPQQQLENAQLVYLASVAKVVITMIMLQAIPENTRQLECDIRIIMELIGETPEKTKDARFKHRLFIQTGEYFKVNKEYLDFFRILEPNVLELECRSILNKILNGEQTTVEQTNIIFSCIQSLPNEIKSSLKFLISIEELVELVLTLSSNAATQFFRELIGPEVIRSLAEKYLKNYHPTITTSGAFHWVQPDANIGKIEEFAIYLDSLLRKADKSPAEAAIVKAINNNPNDFGFDFVHSELGKYLIDNGWEIFEKTGYYPLINWVEDLTKQGFPAHMTMCNVLTLKKGEQVLTFAFSMSIGIRLDENQIVEEININGERIKFNFPDTESREKSDYYKMIKGMAGEIFRNRMTKVINNSLPS